MPPFIEKLLDRYGYVSKEKAAPPSVISSTSLNPFATLTGQKKINPQKALEANTGWVYAAIRAIAMEISGIQFRMFRTGKDGAKEIEDHELLDLLSAVNSYQTGLQLFYSIAAHLEATGNAYIFLEGVNDEKGKPVALHLMQAGKVKILADREQFPPAVQGYAYTLGNKTYRFEPYQVLHIQYPDPNDPLEGVGTIQQIAQWIDADNYAMEFNRRFFLNGARVGGFLENEAALTTEQIDYIKKSFEAAFVGVENAYRVLALPKGVKYEEGGKTQKDLDFANLLDKMRDRIIAGFKVPRTALGITDDVNRANAEATDYVFAARTIKPIMKIITSYLNEFLVPRYGDEFYLSFVDPVPEDRAQKIDEMNKATGGAPVVTINEAREQYLGLDPIQGGDELRVPFSLQPASGSDTPPTPPVQNNSAKGKTVIRTRYSINAKRRKGLIDDTAKRAREILAEQLLDAEKQSNELRSHITTLSDEQFEAIYKGFALRVDKYEKRQRAAVREFNAKQKKEVLSNLADAVKAVDKSRLFDLDKSMAVFVDLATPILTDLAGKEGTEAAKLLGIAEMDILTPSVRRALDRSISLLSKSYNTTTRDLLKAKLEEGLKEGLTLGELAEKVNEVYDYSDDVRADMVARTETFRIANYATQEAWKQSGIVKSQRWYTAADERVCPWCAPLNGKVVGIEDDFFKKGDVVTASDGSKLEIDYSDVGAPPLHVLCRCYIRPEEITLE